MSVRQMFLRRAISISGALVVSLIMPLSTLSAAAVTPCSPPTTYSTPGTHVPTGSDAVTYTYVCDTSSPYYGDWVNPYYVYNPNTDTTKALYSPDYSYDCATSTWYKTRWAYDPPTNQWYSHRVVASDPGLPTNCPVVTPTAPTTNTSSTDPAATSTAATAGLSNTGPNSSNSSNLTGNNNVTLNNTNGLTVNNNLTGVATSGNALVLGNTSAGNASSGNVQDEQNVVNMLQSSVNALGQGGNVITFTDNINGDVNGDLLLDPATLSNVQGSGPNSTNNANTSLNNNLTVNNATNAAVNNNIDVTANSGNATVADNTSGGNATTGSAEGIANVVNMIDSAIQSGKSFIGTININGNLNGDILLPPNFIDQLIADNVPTVTLTGPSSTNTSNTNVNNTTNVTNTNNLGINNTVGASANTGSATVSDNTSAGNATTGNASTKITAFNLTGSNVIGANDLLVFVNVTGTWVGLIVNAPAGATAAELGGGITSSGPNSSNTSNTNVNNTTNINNNVNEQINNNVNCDAKSGNATVKDNTTGGNATSGNADCAVNLLNMENSSLDLSGWFGILFINVFGTWNGSFGINTSAGDPASIASAGGSYSPVLAFVPHNTSKTTTTSSGGGNGLFLTPFGSGGTTTTGSNTTASAVLAAVTKPPKGRTTTPPHVNWTMVIGSASLFVLYLLGERYYTVRQHKAVA